LKSIALIEVGYLSPTLLVTDRCLKSTGVRLLSIENADSGELCIKLAGTASSIQEAAAVAHAVAGQMRVSVRSSLLTSPPEESYRVIDSKPVFGDLLGTYDTYVAREGSMSSSKEAIGLLETQGLSSNLHALDVMLKTADVSVIGKEKIGGGYVTMMIRGDIAAVQAAVEAGKQTVEKLGGKLILADLISNPHPDILALLPVSK
jgi:carbon dioxide concentrating mechanism protein CcmO